MEGFPRKSIAWMRFTTTVSSLHHLAGYCSHCPLAGLLCVCQLVYLTRTSFTIKFTDETIQSSLCYFYGTNEERGSGLSKSKHPKHAKNMPNVLLIL